MLIEYYIVLGRKNREYHLHLKFLEDRIQVTSYGGLMSGLSEQDFFACRSMPRNRELIRVFKDIGLVEQLGSGMNRILNKYSRDIFDISQNFLVVTFKFKNMKNDTVNDTVNDLSEKQKQIFELLKENNKIKKVKCMLLQNTRHQRLVDV